MARTSNREDILDSRDLIARIEELEAERDELQEAYAEAKLERTEAEDEYERDGHTDSFMHTEAGVQLYKAVHEAVVELAEWDGSEEATELKTLQELANENITEWEHGATLIRDSYFTKYAQQLAEDLDMIPEGNKWPSYCIDWEWAARELTMDYTSVEYDGVTYWVRS